VVHEAQKSDQRLKDELSHSNSDPVMRAEE
jgi:hypothetical protein